jgi:hypothetical protein
MGEAIGRPLVAALFPGPGVGERAQVWPFLARRLHAGPPAWTNRSPVPPPWTMVGCRTARRYDQVPKDRRSRHSCRDLPEQLQLFRTDAILERGKSSELLVAIHTSRQSCCKSGKARIFKPFGEVKYFLGGIWSGIEHKRDEEDNVEV